MAGAADPGLSPAAPLSAAEFAALMAPLGPYGQAPGFAVGVSGGPHSLALALLARDFAASRGGRVLALVADHGLRAESAAEAAWTCQTLEAQGIPARLLALGLPRGSAVQERARQARLAALLGACAEAGLPFLMLGQHAGDQAETVLFRALRGSRASGLAGMAPRRAAAEAVILRPLLETAPARLEALLAARGLRPLRDPSNRDPRFTRVRLRQALADPDGTGPGTAALGAAAAAFARRRAGQEAALAARLGAAAALQPEGFAWLDRAALGEDVLAVAALAALLRLLSGSEHAPPHDSVLALLRQGGGTLHGVLWEGRLLCREPAACAAPVPARPGARWDGRWTLRTLPADAGPLTLGALGAGAAAIGRAQRRGLPARVLAGLPALRCAGILLAVPALGLGAPARLGFQPEGGPLPGQTAKNPSRTGL
ncbi:tRNA lysidine(34) synthetase TilS [Pseudoroseomonas cervicalis]|uniref:tRNA lysidine(34) synthetase TilS n=1 Tax=Teichococcus cervicalis TaxID=204525 RepID=UPI0022F154CD|nr:tRNA lysidine(34) synthetase TilS [Pseudoroseomonas cervicalis]WBV41904.1 tRNA lysidine(34) synthetase TilS [Pseudoroseomonas cervicalis]